MEAEGRGKQEMQMQAQPPSSEEIQGTSNNTNTTNDDNKAIVIHKQQGQTRQGGRKTRAAAATRTTSRCTRSQAAPQWTVEETLVLISEVAALDEEDWLKALSSYQRWKMISDNCIAMNVLRSSNQCKRRWEHLLSEYNKISLWESNDACTSGSYWSLQPATRKQLRLPASFDEEVFGSMDAVINAQDPQDTDSEDLIGLPEVAKEDSSYESQGTPEAEASDSDSLVALPEDKGQAEEIIGMLDAEMADADEEDSGSEETGTKTIKRANKEPEMANKLHENAEEIHAILRGELPDNVSQGRGPVNLTRPNALETEFTRRQADELIKSFRVLVSTLDHFTELIRNGECDGSSLMNSRTP